MISELHPSVFGTNNVGSVVVNCPRNKTPAEHWIEFQLVDLEDAPVAWYEYRVVLPNGDNVRGFLDKNGNARIENISEPGMCRISFHALDQDAWEPVETKAPAL